MPRKRCLVTPIGDGWSDETYYERLDQLMTEAAGERYKIGFEYGLLHIIRPEKTERYLFLEILAGPRNKYVRMFPSGQYWTKCIESSRIESVQDELPGIFKPEQSILAIESELFAGEYNVEMPLYELRCIAFNSSFS